MSQAQATEQPASRPTGGSSNVRYVEVAPSTGWHTMAKAVREADEDKIRDCKEDIDTLLVFAGLYSAVLSAFNIESYTALQPNPNDQMIYLLERIAVQTQSYTISSGVLNSTIPSPPPLPTFAAPLWALRVNGLWFASLIVSLATASLSMLVKQWLREYLAFDYTAPRERVRALQYRRPGLKKWKVFEIAAVLPMLLQLSLGLFFVGLCFFTANVDKRMGLTSVPLVSEWAFFLASTTLAPLFSPRCPYKMPLFNSLMRLTRTKITMNLRRAFVVTLGHIDKFFPSSKPSQLHSEVDEEDKLVNSDADDIDILLSTDTIMADDNILLAMWNTLKGRSAPARLLAFIMELIIACVGSEGEYLRPIRLRSIPDLSMLSRKAWDAFMEMLVDLIDIHHSGGPLLVFSPDWLHKATLLLFSSSPYPLPSSANDHLRNLVATYYKDQEPDNAIRSIASWISPRAGEKPFTPRPLIQRLRFLYVDVPPETPILTTWTMSFMYAGLLSTYSPRFHTPATESLSQFFFKNPDIFKQPEALAILDEIWALLDLVLKSDYRTVDRSELLYLGLEYADQMGSRNFAVSSLAATWASSPARYKALYPLARKHHSRGEAPDVHTRMLKLGLDAFCESANQQAIIKNTEIVAADFLRDDFYQSRQLDMVRVCILCITLYCESMKRGTTVSLQLWSALWATISNALHHYWTTKAWENQQILFGLVSSPVLSPDELLSEDRRLAGGCLELIESQGCTAFNGASDTSPPNTIFPDALASALGLYIMPEDLMKYPRLVRVQAQEHLVPADDSSQTDQSISDSSSDPGSEIRVVGAETPSSVLPEECARNQHDEAPARNDEEELAADTAEGDSGIEVVVRREVSDPAIGHSGPHAAAPPGSAEASATDPAGRSDGSDGSMGQAATHVSDDRGETTAPGGVEHAEVDEEGDGNAGEQGAGGEETGDEGTGDDETADDETGDEGTGDVRNGVEELGIDEADREDEDIAM